MKILVIDEFGQNGVYEVRDLKLMMYQLLELIVMWEQL